MNKKYMALFSVLYTSCSAQATDIFPERDLFSLNSSIITAVNQTSATNNIGDIDLQLQDDSNAYIAVTNSFNSANNWQSGNDVDNNAEIGDDSSVIIGDNFSIYGKGNLYI